MDYNLKTKEGKEQYIKYICDKANEVFKDGDRYTYKEIAEILGDEIQKSNTNRSRRIKMWDEHCFNIKQISGTKKYEITNIKKAPTEIVDNRDGNSMFMKYTKPLMLNYMMNNPSGEMIVSRTQLMKDLGFVNDKWGLAHELESNRTLLSKNEELNPTMYDIWDLIDNAGSSFRRVLMNTLYHMKKRFDKDGRPVGMFLIDLDSIYTFVNTVYYMKIDKEEFPAHYETMDKATMDYMISTGKWSPLDFQSEEVHRNSNKEELDEIHSIYRQILTNHKLESFESIPNRDVAYEVYADIDKAIIDTFKCDYYYEKLHIKYRLSDVKMFYDMKEDYHKLVQEFNEMVALNQSVNANKRMLDAYKVVENNTMLKVISLGDYEEVKKTIQTDTDLSKADKMALTRINPNYMDFNDLMINKYIVTGDTTIQDIREKNGFKITHVEPTDFHCYDI